MADTKQTTLTDIYKDLMQRIANSSDPDNMRLTIKEAAVYIPISKQQLAQLRFRGAGPKFLKPSPRIVLYRKKDIDEWLENSVRVPSEVGA